VRERVFMRGIGRRGRWFREETLGQKAMCMWESLAVGERGTGMD